VHAGREPVARSDRFAGVQGNEKSMLISVVLLVGLFLMMGVTRGGREHPTSAGGEEQQATPSRRV
jgi:hypothetical protein